MSKFGEYPVRKGLIERTHRGGHVTYVAFADYKIFWWFKNRYYIDSIDMKRTTNDIVLSDFYFARWHNFNHVFRDRQTAINVLNHLIEKEAEPDKDEIISKKIVYL